MTKLLLTLLLTLALFPWGAYASVMAGGARADAQNSGSAVVLPAFGAGETVTQTSLCHGTPLSGSPCQPLAALLPVSARLPDYLAQVEGAGRAAFWREGPVPQPLLTPPRLH